MKFAILLLLLSAGWFASPSLAARTLDEAVNKASKQGSRQVVSARTEGKGSGRTHVVRVLTPKGKVKTMRYPAHPKQNRKKTKPRK